MNKLFTKIATLVIGMTMAVGVGVAVSGGSKASPVNAETTSDKLVLKNLSGTSGSIKKGTTTIASFSAPNRTVNNAQWRIASSKTMTVTPESGYIINAITFVSNSTATYLPKGNYVADGGSSVGFDLTKGSVAGASINDLEVSELITMTLTSEARITEVSVNYSTSSEKSVKKYTDIEATSYKIVYRLNNSSTNYYMTTTLDSSNRFTTSTTESDAGVFTFTSTGTANKWYLSYDNSGTKTYLKPDTSNGATVRSTSTDGMELTASAGVNGNIRLGAGTSAYYLQRNGTASNNIVGSYTGGQRDIYELIEVAVPASVSISYSGSTSLEYDGSQTQTISMTATAVGIQGTISYVWTSSNSNCLALTSGSGTSSATFTIYSEGTNVSITVAAKVGTETKATSEAIVFNVTNKTFSGVLTITSSPTMNVAISREGSITYTLTGNTNTMDVIEVTSTDEDVIAFVDSENPLAYMILGDDGDKATITLSLSSSTNNLEHYSKTQEITIVDAIPVTDIELNSDSITVKIGGSQMDLVATLTPAQPTINGVVWTSSDTSVVTVSGSETTSEGKSTGALTGVNVGTATITAASAYDPDNIFDTATVTVTAPDDKTLKDISIVAGAGYKQRYSEEDTSVDTTGLSVNAHYVSPTQSTYDETINISATASGVDWTLDLANSRIVVTYGGKTATLTISIVHEFAKNKGEYRLTESNSIQVGDHIAIGGVAVSQGKDWSGKDFVMSEQATNNVRGAQITVSSKKIIANNEANNTDKAAIYDIELVNGFVEGSYALKVGDKYLGSGSTSNRLQLKDNITKDSSFSFTYDSTIGLWKILCLSEVTNARNCMYLNASPTTDNRLFACYENKEDEEGQLPSDYSYLKVFKFEYYVDEANEYATQFNDANICGTDIYTKASATKWSAQSTAFGKLMLGTQNLFTNGTGTGAEITECLERYDRVQYLYYNTEEQSTYNDFMKRVANGQVTPKTYYGVTLFSNTDTNNMVAIVVIVSVVSLTAIGGYFFLKKRREQN